MPVVLTFRCLVLERTVISVFNEPSSSLGSRTRIKTLAQSTLEANAPHFGGSVDAVPRMAITMGVGTIMEAKQCLLLASGASKAGGDCSRSRGDRLQRKCLHRFYRCIRAQLWSSTK